MLQDAKQKRDYEHAKEIEEGRVQAQRLEAQIEADKKNKIIKKKEERDAAMKVIKDNQEEKKKRQADELKRKERETKEI
jgi:hypothetical protein